MFSVGNSRTCILLLAVLVVGWSACAKTGYRAVKVAKGDQGMVVSAHPLASQVGRDILKAGGSATDAAIATQFALAVVCPHAGNLGGGGFWVYAPVEDAVRTLDYRERAPSAASRDMFLTSDGSVDIEAARNGALAAGIPGQVDGMYLAFTFGTKLNNWRLLLEPAAKLAREGFRISAQEADQLNTYRESFVTFNDFAFPFVKDTPWREGDRLKQAQLANTLDSLATIGATYFYDGRFAERLSAEVQERGGIWSPEDLSGYYSVYRDPIEMAMGEYTVFAMGPPSSGGVALAQVLGLLQGYDLAKIYRNDTVAYYHLLIEAMRRAYEDRANYLGDPDFVKISIDSLVSPSYLAAKWSSFRPDSATKSVGSIRTQGKEVYETTHTSVVDGEGNAVSVTTTLNGNYGCKVWSRVGGFFLNNEMDNFSTRPGIPNEFGHVDGEANAILPSKRMLSSMTPTIVKRGEEVHLVLGSPGGLNIVTAVLQVMLNDLVHKQTLPNAVSRERLHHQWLPDEVVHEANTFSPRVRQALLAKGHKLRQVESVGRVKAIARVDNHWLGVGDKRNPDDAAVGF